MSEFDHFILTRYSVVLGENQEPAPADWLWYRLGFFVEACEASIASQTNKDFRWLVFADDRCPDDFRSELDEIAVGLFEPIWSHQPFPAGLYRDEVVRRAEAPFLLTTRLDSDDALARDFVGALHAEFDHQERLFVNFPRGLQIDRSGAVHRADDPSNAFVSLIESRSPDRPPHTIFGSPAHPQVRRDGPLRQVITGPMWLQVVHGGNVINDIWGARVAPAIVDDRFDIPLEFRRSVSVPLLAYERVTRGARIWVRRLTDRYLLRQWVSARVDRLKGSHTKPQRRAVAP